MAELQSLVLVSEYLRTNPNSKVLIIGGKTTNFPESLRDNPRLVFWDSIDPHTRVHKKIPEGVRIILTTRFISHKLVWRVRKLLPEGVIFVTKPQGTGMIRKLFEEERIGSESEKTKTRKTAPKTAKRKSSLSKMPGILAQTGLERPRAVKASEKTRLSRETHVKDIISFKDLKRHLGF